jgi:ferritin-like protein
MDSMWSSMKTTINRRSFVKNRLTAAGAATIGAGIVANSSSLLAEKGPEEHSGRLTPGAAALLRFAAAAEILETDFWVQYNELGGIQDSEVPGGSGNPAYTAALEVLDSDMAQYIHDNTDDEFTHQNFLNAYLASKGADTVDLEPFRTLPGSTATGSSGKLRLTNLMQLTLDTSWWTRYRSSTHNPDLDPNFTFPQAVPTLAIGQHTAIPRTDADTSDPNFLQAIANTAGFHFPTIEQGGNSLYPSMAQRATHVEVLRILISIGPTETMHFQTWSDKAGNAPR